MSKAFSVLSGLIFLYAFSPYIKAILRKEATPRKATWLVWAAGDIVTLSGMLAKHTFSWQMVAASIGASTVFFLAILNGEPGWTKRDKVCLSIAFLAIVLWMYFGDSNVGIALSLIALAVAAWPTYVSAWEKPENEDRKTWFFFNLSSILAILAIPSCTFANAAPPIVFLAIDIPMIFLVVARSRK